MDLNNIILICQGRPHTTLSGGGHFIQEDCGEELSQVVINWLKDL